MATSATSSFGEVLGRFRKAWTLPVGWLLLFALPVALLYGAIRPGEPLWGPLLGIVALWGPGVAAVIDRLTYRVTLFERGVQVKSLFGVKSVALGPRTRIFYKAVRESINGIPAGTRTSLKLVDGQASVHLRSSIKGIESLNDHIAEFEQSTILPIRREALLKGQWVDLGAVRLRLGELVVRSKRIAAAEISGLEVRAGRLLVNKVGQRIMTFAQVNLHEVANLHTLFALLPLLSAPRPADAVG